MNNPGAIKGISSGYRRLDLTLDGLQPGAMIVLAARPGVGKTAALVNILTNICLGGTPVGMFSLEMPKSQLLERILYGMAGINSDDIRRGRPMTVGQQQHFTAAVRKITAAPLHIDDESSLTIDSIRARGRRMVREHGVKCIGVDYLQLVRSTTQQARGSREREVSEISAGLKSLAKELNIPVLVLAQLNRDVEKRAGNAKGKPVVSDLRDSGSIEQDADQIIMIHRPYMYKPDKHDPTEAQWIIGKNRFGRLGRIQFRWTAELTKYEEKQKYPSPTNETPQTIPAKKQADAARKARILQTALNASGGSQKERQTCRAGTWHQRQTGSRRTRQQHYQCSGIRRTLPSSRRPHSGTSRSPIWQD